MVTKKLSALLLGVALFTGTRQAHGHVLQHGGVADFPGTLDTIAGTTITSSKHVIVATTVGDVYDVVWSGGSHSNRYLGSFPGVVGIGGFYTNNDGFNHAIIAQSNGNITERFYNAGGVYGGVIASYPPASYGTITAISAHYSFDTTPGNSDGWKHIGIAFSTNNVYQLRYNGTFAFRGFSQSYSGTIVDIGSFYTPFDGNNHIIVLTTTGALYEIYYSGDNPNGFGYLYTNPGDSEWAVDGITHGTYCNAGYRDYVYAGSNLTGGAYEVFDYRWGGGPAVTQDYVTSGTGTIVAMGSANVGVSATELAVAYASSSYDNLYTYLSLGCGGGFQGANYIGSF